MEIISLVTANLISPPIVAFVAGLGAVWLRSDFSIPAPLYQSLTIYLLLAIGFKGGASLAQTPWVEMVWPLLIVLILGVVTPVVVYGWARLWLFSKVDAAALAAHYGSVSAVTFIAATVFLEGKGVWYEPYAPALMALLEFPAILVALLLARGKGSLKTGLKGVLRELLAGKSIFLLLTGLMVGASAGVDGERMVAPFLVAPFYGILILFLLEMGMTAAQRAGDLRKTGLRLLGVALLLPPVLAFAGISMAALVGMSLGGAVIMGVMAGSASYIAAPAAVRVSLPEANPGFYITAALGITFPFNLTLGIPLYYYMAGWFY